MSRDGLGRVGSEGFPNFAGRDWFTLTPPDPYKALKECELGNRRYLHVRARFSDLRENSILPLPTSRADLDPPKGLGWG